MAKKDAGPDRLRELKQAIKAKQPDRLYFFWGEETFLLNYYLDQLKKLLLDPLTESFNFHRFSGENFSLQKFADAVENLPMMADATLVQVEDVDPFKQDESSREKLGEIFHDIPDYCTVVFTYITVPWKPDKRMKKLWEAIDGRDVEFARQQEKDLIPWVARHFQAQGKRINAQLCQYLIGLTDGTMTSLIGEISKICSFSGANEIVKADIDTVTEPVLDAVVFQMTDCLSLGQYRQALEKLSDLLKMQQEPIAVLGAIGSSFRRLGAARRLLDRGKDSYALQKLCALPDFVARKTMNSARRFPPSYLKKASELILETDYRMKSSYDDNERLLELLVLTLAQEAENG